MNDRNHKMPLLRALALVFLFCELATAADEPSNVAGTWNASVSGEAGSAEQTIVLKLEGTKISGTFKGPR